MLMTMEILMQSHLAVRSMFPLHTNRSISNHGSVGGLGRDLSGSEGESFFPACATCHRVLTLTDLAVVA